MKDFKYCISCAAQNEVQETVCWCCGDLILELDLSGYKPKQYAINGETFKGTWPEAREKARDVAARIALKTGKLLADVSIEIEEIY